MTTSSSVAGAGRAMRRWRTGYILLRVSGLLLAVLVLGHFAVTHVTTDVADTGSRFIDRRWASALWLGWDGLMLATTLVHAVLGMWAVTADYAEGRRRRLVRGTLLAAAAVVLIGGMLVLVLAAGAR